MEDEADVLIIGAGVAGLAAARELSAAEQKVIGTVHGAIATGLRAAREMLNKTYSRKDAKAQS